MKQLKLLFVFSIFITLQSCGLFNVPSRTETDAYTVVYKDTTHKTFVTNSPDNRDRGVVTPSDKEIKQEREILQKDSSVERTYPDFIRWGLFEAIGTIGGDSDYSLGNGLFGMYPDFASAFDDERDGDGSFLTGGIYRIGIVEHRLRWFDDAPNWTLGTHAFEIMLFDRQAEKNVMSILPLYLRKRYFLSEDIPYIAITPSLGLGYFPSQYANLSVSLDVGSYGGLNLRAYLGGVFGLNTSSSPFISGNDFAQTGAQTTFRVYGGLGISMFDFLNLQKETEEEWKDMQHSSWDLSLVRLSLNISGADRSVFGASTEDLYVKGISGQILNADVVLPILDKHFSLGTSLLSIHSFGLQEWGMGVLPLRVGYWKTLLNEELSVEPFYEFSYYPSTIHNLGAKLHLNLNKYYNLFLVAGFASGSPVSSMSNDLIKEWGIAKDFSVLYFGIGIEFPAKLFKEGEIRYFKD